MIQGYWNTGPGPSVFKPLSLARVGVPEPLMMTQSKTGCNSSPQPEEWEQRVLGQLEKNEDTCQTEKQGQGAAVWSFTPGQGVLSTKGRGILKSFFPVEELRPTARRLAPAGERWSWLPIWQDSESPWRGNVDVSVPGFLSSLRWGDPPSMRTAHHGLRPWAESKGEQELGSSVDPSVS